MIICGSSGKDDKTVFIRCEHLANACSVEIYHNAGNGLIIPVSDHQGIACGCGGGGGPLEIVNDRSKLGLETKVASLRVDDGALFIYDQGGGIILNIHPFPVRKAVRSAENPMGKESPKDVL